MQRNGSKRIISTENLSPVDIQSVVHSQVAPARRRGATLLTPSFPPRCPSLGASPNLDPDSACACLFVFSCDSCPRCVPSAYPLSYPLPPPTVRGKKKH